MAAQLHSIRGSEYGTKIALALAAKGVDFEFHAASLSRKERGKYFPRKTEDAKAAYIHVPVVRFASGDVVVESADINSYLDEKFPDVGSPIYPNGKKEQIRELEDRMGGKLYFGGQMLSTQDFDYFMKGMAFAVYEALGTAGTVLKRLGPVKRAALKAIWKSKLKPRPREKLRHEGSEFVGWLDMDYESVKAEVFDEYKEMDSLLKESSTTFFFDCEGPTAADLFLHALMRRISGDGMGYFPGCFGEPKDAFNGFPSLIEHYATMASDSWVPVNAQGHKVPYRYDSIKMVNPGDDTPLGVPINAEKCP